MNIRNSLAELINDLGDDEILEVGCKFGVNPSNLSKEDFANAISNQIRANLSDCMIYYSDSELEFLNKILTNETHEIDANIDMNVFLCDGLLGLKKEDETEKFYATNDLIDSYKNFSKNDKILNYNKLSNTIIGIVKTYGIISLDDLFDIYTKISNDTINYDDFEHFLFYRSEILNSLNLFEHDQEFIYIDQVDEPDELVHMIMHCHYDYKIFSQDEYIANNSYEYVCNQNLLTNLENYIKQFVNDENKYNDLIETIMYDIKIENYEDLILDISTYITIATNEEHEKIKKLLEDLYVTTIKWTKKGNI